MGGGGGGGSVLYRHVFVVETETPVFFRLCCCFFFFFLFFFVVFKGNRHRFFFADYVDVKRNVNIRTLFALSIRTPQLLTTLALKFEQIRFTTHCCVQKLLYEWKTVQTQMRRRVLRRLIWVYTVCPGLYVRILTVYTVTVTMLSTSFGETFIVLMGKIVIDNFFLFMSNVPLLNKLLFYQKY